MDDGGHDGGRLVALLLGALVLSSLFAGLVVAAAPAGTGDAAAGTESTSFAQAVDPDRTRIRIALQANGDGRWTLELWTRLDDADAETAFEQLQAEIRNDSDAYTSDFRARMNGSVAAASELTGRPMALENLTVATRTEAIPRSYGVLVYEFEWTNFAAVDGQELRAGRAIDGFLLETNTRLTITWPDAYRVASVDPAPDDRTDSAVVWQGSETDFVTDQPRIVVTTASTDDSVLPLVAVVGGLVALLFVLAWLVHSGRLERPAVLGGAEAGGAGAASGGETESAAAAASAQAPSPAASTDASDAAATTGDASGTGDGSSDPDADGNGGEPSATDGPPPELLSNEEQVLHVLEDNGGRMKQQQVVAELEWTEAKTSQVVTGMRDEDRIEVFRIGRENVLALPGEADL